METADTQISRMISLAQTIAVVKCEDLEFTDHCSCDSWRFGVHRRDWQQGNEVTTHETA